MSKGHKRLFTAQNSSVGYLELNKHFSGVGNKMTD